MSELAIHTNVENSPLYACRVLKKAQRLRMKTAVLFDDPNRMDVFDNLLWTFEPSSFIPHRVAEGQSASSNPMEVVLTTNPALLPEADMLVLQTRNAHVDIVALTQRFPKVIDIVASKDPELTEGRRRFVAYRKYGLTPVVHKRG